jgi:FKBP-type peptidyl-prolyl cis-trans isomerase (trigger factor)
MLAFSNRFHEGNNATIQVTLNEIDCVVLPDIDNNIIQRYAIFVLNENKYYLVTI